MRLLVAGGGLGGLVAAVRALELGAAVTVLEKGDRPGGSFLYSSGYVWAYRDLPTFRREAPGGDPALQALVLDRLEDALLWLESRGGVLLSRETGNPLTFGARFDPEPTAAALAGRLEMGGGRLLLRHALRGLLRDGRVRGALVEREDGRGEEEADAVVLATGGFAANPELVRKHIIRGPGRLLLRAHPWSTGDGFLAALEAGARTGPGLGEFYGRNLPAPPARFGPKLFVEVSQLYGRYAVAVNLEGVRYADEAADWSETALVQATARQPRQRAWYLLDAAGLRRRVRERSVEEMVEAARRVGGTVLRAPSLEELARLLGERGVPEGRLLRTLRGYNAAVEAGRAEELRPPRSGEAPVLREPPFTAVEVAPAITHTIGGLAVDVGGRVLREDGRPVGGLYAAGVEAGGLAAGGYASGLAAALVLGLVSAETAVGEATSL
ncbi:MAG: FAD-dependent oxidoreductase [Rubrobacter sp.]|nr:FAD-dependent oxidoreductase [Rubrobacter sp.]